MTCAPKIQTLSLDIWQYVDFSHLFAKLPTEAPNSTATTSVASYSLDWVNVGDPDNSYTRIFTSIAAEATPDANGLTLYRSTRHINIHGVETQWVLNSDPLRKDDVHWNGAAWVDCPLGTQTPVR